MYFFSRQTYGVIAGNGVQEDNIEAGEYPISVITMFYH